VNKTTVIFSLCLALVLAHSPRVAADDISLDQCQKLKDKIDHYANLRRAGGSASRMDSWKRSRRKKQEVFNEKECWRYRGELR
jgi:hypothetical protein